MSYANESHDGMMIGPESDAGAFSAPFADRRHVDVRPPMMDTAESSKMTPQILLLLLATGLKRCWKWALPLGLVLGAVAAACLWFTFPIKYEAKAWIQIMFNKPYYVYDEKMAAQQYDKFVATQFALIRTPIILDKVRDNPEVGRLPELQKQKDPIEWIASRLRLVSTGSELVTVAFEMEDPRAAQLIVENAVLAYIEYNNNELNNWNMKLINQLNIELARKQQEAQLLQQEIRSKTSQASRRNVSSSKEGGVNFGETLQQDVWRAESQLDALRAGYETLKEYRDSKIVIPEDMLQQAIETDPVYLTLLAQRSEWEAARERNKNAYQPGSSQFQQYDKTIADLDVQIKTRLEMLARTKPEELKRMIRQDLDSSLWEKKIALDTQQSLSESLKAKLALQKTDIDKGASDMIDVSFSNAQLARVNTVLDLLNTRIVALKTEQHAPNRVVLKQRPSLPTQPKTAKRVPFALIGGTACFFLPFGIGVALERMRPRLYHVSQIRAAVPSVIIGEIMEPPVAWVHGAMFRKRLARYRESVHSWCTHLLLSHPFNQARTLAIASVAGDDGKTFLAIQVAVAMAQMKSGPVLLIDGDMRVGRMHLLFGNEEPGIGLADVLAFRKGLGEGIVVNEKEPNLHLLSSGNLDVSPYELLGDGRFRELLDMLEKNYALILVVLPPVANAAESLVMAQSVDSVLLCVRQGETILAAMEDVFRKLVNTGSNVDGVVVKDVPYSQMAGKDGGFADKVEQVRLAHLLHYND